MKRRPSPIAWTIAGSDSGGGAGIQADLLTMHGLGVHGCTILTALTAQSTRGVSSIEPVSGTMLAAQIHALSEDLPPHAIKIGMLGTEEIATQVALALPGFNVPVVCDSVLAASTKHPLLDGAGFDIMKDKIFPHVDLLTPNLPEATTLLQRPVESDDDIEQAAADLRKLGPKAVLIKGGHRDGTFCQDYFSSEGQSFWLTGPRIQAAGSHGTGCTLSSAIAASLALGYPMVDSVVIARTYINQALRLSSPLGSGDGPLHHGGWPTNPSDLPWITDTTKEGRNRLCFPDCDALPHGLYPIVDSLDWIKRLLPLGLKVVQLRIKDRNAPGREQDIAEAIRLARNTNTRLYINDHWQLAITHGAYGVHLGQDDMDPTALRALQDAGLRLGLSTHCDVELARALAVRPSYAALGTLFRTDSKVMDYEPLGLPEFTRLRRLSDRPLVAIGGIHLDRAREVLDAGADGIAVISEVTQSSDLERTVSDWHAILTTAM